MATKQSDMTDTQHFEWWKTKLARMERVGVTLVRDAVAEWRRQRREYSEVRPHSTSAISRRPSSSRSRRSKAAV